jgi:hypothetical protein
MSDLVNAMRDAWKHGDTTHRGLVLLGAVLLTLAGGLLVVFVVGLALMVVIDYGVLPLLIPVVLVGVIAWVWWKVLSA